MKRMMAAAITGFLAAALGMSWLVPSPGQLPPAAGQGALVLPDIAIDANPQGNTATFVGQVEDCFEVSGTVPLDFQVDIVLPPPGVPPFDGTNGDITLHQYDISWSPDILDATEPPTENQGMLERSGGRSIPVANGYDPVAQPPQSNAFNDLGSNFENGPGVLDRLTFAATDTGLVTLTLSGVIVGDAHAPVPENLVTQGTVIGSANVAIGVPCAPPPPPTEVVTETPAPSPEGTPSPQPDATPGPGTPGPGTPSAPTPSTGSPTPGSTPGPTGGDNGLGTGAWIGIGVGAGAVALAAAGGGWWLLARRRRA